MGGASTGSALHRARKAIGGARRRVLATEAAEHLGDRIGWRTITVLGDSHAHVFDRIRNQHLLRHTRVEVIAVRGATARGLANPNSRTNAPERYRAELAHLPAARRLVIMLGEVDAGYLDWHLSDLHGTPVDEELAESLARHLAFLDGLWAAGRTRLCLISVCPPTVEDYTRWPGLHGARSQVTATLDQRAAATRTYNAGLATWAADHGCAFVDLDPDVVDPTTGRVRPAFTNADPGDHHLDQDRLAALLVTHLQDLDWDAATTRSPR